MTFRDAANGDPGGVCGLVFYVFTCGELLELEPPSRSSFMDSVVQTVAAAERFGGFLWRAPSTLEFDENGEFRGVKYDAVPSWLTHLPVGRVLQTLSAWSSLDAAKSFAYRSPEHAAALRRRREWAVKLHRPVYVAWCGPYATWPTWAEGVRRVEMIALHGPTDEAFDFRNVPDGAVPTT